MIADRDTVAAYDRDPAGHVDDWEGQPSPVDLHAVVERFFRHGRTADAGCGSGRDTAWLAARGVDAIGYDASSGLLGEARRRHPEVPFAAASLPGLDGVPSGAYTNVPCETVIMHLPPGTVVPAVRRLVSLLDSGGTLYLRWRVTERGLVRDHAGRLYAAFDARLVRAALQGTDILHEEEGASASSARRVHRLVARRTDRPVPAPRARS
ncbi:class I SAM-dependent methyltransferase [Blastococcus sp. VKM Ac-2987]|uniref:class I SAM-dependent methyltransferase n=1 Tax=Blastococcus sp. VKM Ac-2987 TaxID=3004141 RepID=UPI0022AB9D09|nr:class I SAM-dependent methyltransferase [Blastococcus sp. VKM Ac-2987]MCZ2860851.1 class I SAM-dependent methyltransferase [Blastococcus sp. VKM Ac-2987]